MLPTKDGVQVGIDAAVFFRYIGESDIATLELFDMSVGTRRFATTNGRRLYPWQGDDGFGAMLDSLFRPVLENDLRKEVGGLPCAALVSSPLQPAPKLGSEMVRVRRGGGGMMIRERVLKAVATVALLWLASVVPASAQADGRFVGTVVDASGAFVQPLAAPT